MKVIKLFFKNKIVEIKDALIHIKNNILHFLFFILAFLFIETFFVMIVGIGANTMRVFNISTVIFLFVVFVGINIFFAIIGEKHNRFYDMME